MLHSFPFVLRYKYKYKASYERNFCRKEIEKKEMLSMPQFTCMIFQQGVNQSLLRLEFCCMTGRKWKKARSRYIMF